eukprot:10277187-Ditylum_brightwellii.AAC.1
MGFNDNTMSSTEPVTAGKQHLLVDARDAEFSKDNTMLYQATMALSAQEIISLSTLALDPVILIYPPYQRHPTIQQCVWYILPTAVLKCVL